jgi:hypothetical protein
MLKGEKEDKAVIWKGLDRWTLGETCPNFVQMDLRVQRKEKRYSTLKKPFSSVKNTRKTADIQRDKST